MLPYEYGAIQIEETGNRFEGFGSSCDVNDENLPIIDVSYKSIPFLIGSFLIWHFFGMTSGGIVAFVVERSIATLYLKDYECKSRIWLTIGISGLMHTWALSATWSYFTHQLSLVTLIVINIFGMAFLLPYFYFLRRYNNHASERMTIRNIKMYSLAAKFQIEENVRAMKVAARIAHMFGGILVVMTCILLLYHFNVVPPKMAFHMIEFFLMVLPLFVVPKSASCVAEWQFAFFSRLPIFRDRIRPTGIHTVEKKTTAETAAIYFQQLQNSWI